MQQVSKVLFGQDRKVDLLEVELLVSSEMLFLFSVLTELLHVYFGRSNVVFAILFLLLCKINLFSVKPLWGFILVSSETMYWLLSFSEKTICF